MKYRSRIDLIAVILICAAEEYGALMTHIMYSSFLSHGQLKKILPSLITDGLLEYDEKNRVYKTTGKGTQYLKLYKQMEQLIKIKNAD